MIHSLSGGIWHKKQYYDFAKVDIDGKNFWYISNIIFLQAGDKVEVDFMGIKKCGTVIRIDKDVPQDHAPIPVNRAKQIIKKL